MIRLIAVVAFALLWFGDVPIARADAVVTLCHQDTDPGFGLNLAAALKTGGHITFQCAGGPATIAVTQNYTIGADTTIDGNKTVTLDARSGIALFTIQGVAFTLTGLRITHATTSAPETGSVLSGQGTINIIDSRIEGCDTPVFIGDINRATPTSGTLSVATTTFVNNTGTSIEARGIAWLVKLQHVTFTNDYSALAIQADKVTLTDVTLTGSHGYNFVSVNDVAQISRSTVSDNDTGLSAFLDLGCYTTTTCKISVANSTFARNQSGSGGGLLLSNGAVKLSAVSFLNNAASRAGGAIAYRQATTSRSLTITHGVFRGNKATKSGGAIDFGDEAGGTPVQFMANAVEFADNTAGRTGGAISGNAQLTINRGVFVDNTAQVSGGAIALGIGDAAGSLFSNTLIARNAAPTGGGFSGYRAAFINATIAENTGGGVAFDEGVPMSGLGISMKNTIIARNTPQNCSLTDRTAAALTDGGHNIQFPRRSCGLGPMLADPRLDPVYIPVAGGPAYEHGDEATCEAQPVSGRDVFNQRRPQNSACTIGAAEGMPEQFIDAAVRMLGGSGIGGTVADGSTSAGGSAGDPNSGSSGQTTGGSKPGSGILCDCYCKLICSSPITSK